MSADIRSHTHHEILSQPSSWKETIGHLSSPEGNSFSFDQYSQVLVTGCGSTYYLSVWAARSLQEKTGLTCRPVPAAELWLSPGSWYNPGSSNLLIAISRSGSTSETIHAVKEFQASAAGETFAVSCAPDSELAELSSAGYYFPHAQEKSIAQTRTFTNMMLGAAYLAGEPVPEDLPGLLSLEFEVLRQEFNKIMETGLYKSVQKFFFLGSGPRYGLASEAMLKMKEMSLSYSESYHFLEFRHGPMSMVDENSLIIGFLGSGTYQQELSVLKDMRKLGGQLLAIGEKSLPIPEWVETYIPLDLSKAGRYGDVLFLPLLQLLALENALAKGLDPDNPQNLSAVIVL